MRRKEHCVSKVGVICHSGFDEGLAMQIDYRERDAWPLNAGAVDSGAVRFLETC